MMLEHSTTHAFNSNGYRAVDTSHSWQTKLLMYHEKNVKASQHQTIPELSPKLWAPSPVESTSTK
jgi:hypothetical protein